MSKQYAHIENAVIESAEIQLSRGFALDCWLHLRFGSGGQGFGGYVLGGTSGEAGKHSEQPNIAAEFICAVLVAAGVESFSALNGKTIRIAKDSPRGTIKAIGHIVDRDKWFDPSERLQGMMAKRTESQS